MNTLRKSVLLAAALAPTSASALAGKAAKPFEADFDKCFMQNGPGACVFTFSGPVTGDVSGHVDANAGPDWLIGAGVLDEFVGYTRADGVPCAKGTLYVTPRWKQTHGDDTTHARGLP